jgi:hypothetical protein
VLQSTLVMRRGGDITIAGRLSRGSASASSSRRHTLAEHRAAPTSAICDELFKKDSIVRHIVGSAITNDGQGAGCRASAIKSAAGAKHLLFSKVMCCKREVVA